MDAGGRVTPSELDVCGPQRTPVDSRQSFGTKRSWVQIPPARLTFPQVTMAAWPDMVSPCSGRGTQSGAQTSDMGSPAHSQTRRRRSRRRSSAGAKMSASPSGGWRPVPRTTCALRPAPVDAHPDPMKRAAATSHRWRTDALGDAVASAPVAGPITPPRVTTSHPPRTYGPASKSHRPQRTLVTLRGCREPGLGENRCRPTAAFEGPVRTASADFRPHRFGHRASADQGVDSWVRACP